MNRSFASWIADSPGPAVLVTGLLGLLPLFGLGFAFFLPGAVPALVVEDLARLEAQQLPSGDELLLIGRRHQHRRRGRARTHQAVAGAVAPPPQLAILLQRKIRRR